MTVSSKIFTYLNSYIQLYSAKRLALFWIVFSFLFNIFCIYFTEYKAIYGIYNREEIYLNNASISVSGRPYDKSLLISNVENEYKANCLGLADSICNNYFNQSISVDKLKFIRMVDNSGFISYIEFIDPVRNNKVIVNNKKNEKELEIKYKGQQKTIFYILIISDFLAIFFMFLWLFSIYKSRKLSYK